jgi:hypothetical protein
MEKYDEVEQLLAPLKPVEFQQHHESVLRNASQASAPRKHACSRLEVLPDAGNGKGKGLFATEAIPGGTMMFREAPLVRFLAIDAAHHW